MATNLNPVSSLLSLLLPDISFVRFCFVSFEDDDDEKEFFINVKVGICGTGIVAKLNDYRMVHPNDKVENLLEEIHEGLALYLDGMICGWSENIFMEKDKLCEWFDGSPNIYIAKIDGERMSNDMALCGGMNVVVEMTKENKEDFNKT